MNIFILFYFFSMNVYFYFMPSNIFLKSLLDFPLLDCSLEGDLSSDLAAADVGLAETGGFFNDLGTSETCVLALPLLKNKKT
jgi:hypothetical protein